MYTFKRMTNLVLVFLVLNLVTSYKKVEIKQLNRSVENTESSNEVDKPTGPCRTEIYSYSISLLSWRFNCALIFYA